MLHGEVSRRRGRWADARASFEASQRQYLHLGQDGQALFPSLNLALVAGLEDRHQESEALARELLRAFQERDHTRGQLVCHAALLPSFAATGRWESFDASLQAIIQRGHAEAIADDDVAALLTRAARFARQAGRARRASACIAEAQHQYRQLGRSEEADALRLRG